MWHAIMGFILYLYSNTLLLQYVHGTPIRRSTQHLAHFQIGHIILQYKIFLFHYSLLRKKKPPARVLRYYST